MFIDNNAEARSTYEYDRIDHIHAVVTDDESYGDDDNGLPYPVRVCGQQWEYLTAVCMTCGTREIVSHTEFDVFMSCGWSHIGDYQTFKWVVLEDICLGDEKFAVYMDIVARIMKTKPTGHWTPKTWAAIRWQAHRELYHRALTHNTAYLQSLAGYDWTNNRVFTYAAFWQVTRHQAERQWRKSQQEK